MLMARVRSRAAVEDDEECEQRPEHRARLPVEVRQRAALLDETPLDLQDGHMQADQHPEDRILGHHRQHGVPPSLEEDPLLDIRIVVERHGTCSRQMSARRWRRWMVCVRPNALYSRKVHRAVMSGYGRRVKSPLEFGGGWAEIHVTLHLFRGGWLYCTTLDLCTVGRLAPPSVALAHGQDAATINPNTAHACSK